MRSRATSSAVRRKCVASGRKTARCRPHWAWRAAPSRPRISSPWPLPRHRRPCGIKVAPHIVGIIGPGRAGVGLALALARAEEGRRYDVRLHGRSKKAVPKPLKLTVGPENEPPAWIAQAGVVILSVPADPLLPLAQGLAPAASMPAGHVALTLSVAHGAAEPRPRVRWR